MRARFWPVALILAAAGLAAPLARSGQLPPSAARHLSPPPRADNPQTPEKAALGRLLFWDPILSGPKDVSCASCHHPDFGYSDGFALSRGVGVRVAKRNSQTVLNTAFNGLTATTPAAPALAPMFWDLRARGLEAQALEPLKAADEMRGDTYGEDAAVAVVVARLRANREYVALFTAAFGGSDTSVVSAVNLGRALAAFQRTLVAVDAPFDRYMRGDRSAMTAQQIEGMQAFERVGCANCHGGSMFSDFKTHVLTVPDHPEASTPDDGMDGTHAFRTPTLRNLAFTAPYMHSGVFDSLGDVLRFYNRIDDGDRRGRRGRRGGAAVAAGVRVDPLIRELRGVGRSRPEIIAFLEALNDDRFDRTIPARVPSGLRPGGRVPGETRQGRGL